MAASPVIALVIPEGADFVQEFFAVDEEGNPVDLTGYDDLRAEFRITQSPTGTLEATATVSLTTPSLGGFKIVIDHDDTYAMSATSGFWTCQLEDTSVPESRFTPVRGTYTLEATTIVTP